MYIYNANIVPFEGVLTKAHVELLAVALRLQRLSVARALEAEIVAKRCSTRPGARRGIHVLYSIL